MSSGVLPNRSRAVMSAPASISALATSSDWARWRGVRPYVIAHIELGARSKQHLYAGAAFGFMQGSQLVAIFCVWVGSARKQQGGPIGHSMAAQCSGAYRCWRMRLRLRHVGAAPGRWIGGFEWLRYAKVSSRKRYALPKAAPCLINQSAIDRWPRSSKWSRNPSRCPWPRYRLLLVAVSLRDGGFVGEVKLLLDLSGTGHVGIEDRIAQVD